MVTASTSTPQKVRLADLRPYHRQAALFPNTGVNEIERLAADMRERGLQIPIEILPDRTILCGHSRVQAAALLQWTEIDAVIRHDLAGLPDTVIERHVIADNLARRQLRPLAQARCAQRLRELFHGGETQKLSFDQQCDVECHTRDAIGEMMGCSGRHVSRLLAALSSPLAVRQACDAGLLSVDLAAKIANLSPDRQDAIAKLIGEGVDPKTAAYRFVWHKRRPNAEESVYRRLVRTLAEADEAFAESFDDVRLIGVGDLNVVDVLERSVPLVEALLDYIRERQAAGEQALADKMEEVSELLNSAAATE
jgi:ParB family chromosome partitioning protein